MFHASATSEEIKAYCEGRVKDRTIKVHAFHSQMYTKLSDLFPSRSARLGHLNVAIPRKAETVMEYKAAEVLDKLIFNPYNHQLERKRRPPPCSPYNRHEPVNMGS